MLLSLDRIAFDIATMTLRGRDVSFKPTFRGRFLLVALLVALAVESVTGRKGYPSAADHGSGPDSVAV